MYVMPSYYFRNLPRHFLLRKKMFNNAQNVLRMMLDEAQKLFRDMHKMCQKVN